MILILKRHHYSDSDVEVPKPGEMIDPKQNKGDSPQQRPPSDPTKDIQVERMKTQRQQMQILHQKQQQIAKMEASKARSVASKQRMEQERALTENRNAFRAHLKEKSILVSKPRDLSLYKQRPKIAKTKPMPRLHHK